jgi:hypothetical protein
MEQFKKENPPNHFETEVANYVQIGLMKRYLKKELGENYTVSEKKAEYEKNWVEKYQHIFRIIFDENKEEFLRTYKEDKDALINAVEEALEDPL